MFKGDIGLQARKFSEMLELLVDGLEDFDQHLPALYALGQRHVAYGVVPANYDTLATAFLWALGRMLHPDFSPEVKDAWEAWLGEVSAAMQTGAAELPPGASV